MKPTVLHIYKDYFPPVVGGIEKTLHLMCQGTKDEFDVRVLIARRERGLSTKRYSLDGIEIIEAPSLGRVSSAPACPTFPILLRKLKSDIFHFHFPNPTGEISYMIMEPPGRVVVTYHSDIVRQKTALLVYRPFIYRFLECADIILPTSPNYIEHSAFLSRFRDKCEVMPLGIDFKQFDRSDSVRERALALREKFSTPIVLFVGVLRYYKGLHFLLRAMKTVDATLIIVGSGPEEEGLRGMCREHSIDEKIFFAGSVSDEEKVSYLYASDIFCLPSHLPSEAYGISQIEAMICGLPVVSTSLSTGVSFVNKDHESGLIVPPAEPESLARALNLLVRDDRMRKELGVRARERAQKYFSADTMNNHLKSVYHSLLSLA